MDKAMTVRFNEERMKQLESMQGIGWDKLKKSQVLRMAVSFMFECASQIPKGLGTENFWLPDDLNKKFKTKLSTSKWQW